MDTLARKYADRLHRDAGIGRYTAARLGGNADWLYVAKETVDELIDVVATAWRAGVPVRVLGGGANVLVSDAGFRGLIVVNRLGDIQRGDWHDGRNVSAESGAGLTQICRKAQAWGLSGFEWAVAVPGTLGGAIVNNAGAHGGDMAQSVADVVIIEADADSTPLPRLYTRDDLAYDYRTSTLKHRTDKRFLVLLATLIFTPDDPAHIQARMDTYNAHRKRTQPQGASLGSIFKNPPGDYAGRLIESAGLKGYRIGGAEVSPVHANFFINSAGKTGSAGDYYALVRHVQGVVQEHSGILLEPEIEFIGF